MDSKHSIYFTWKGSIEFHSWQILSPEKFYSNVSDRQCLDKNNANFCKRTWSLFFKEYEDIKRSVWLQLFHFRFIFVTHFIKFQSFWQSVNKYTKLCKVRTLNSFMIRKSSSSFSHILYDIFLLFFKINFHFHLLFEIRLFF